MFNFIRMVIPKLTRDLPTPSSMDGVLKLPIEQIYKGGESKARNQRSLKNFVSRHDTVISRHDMVVSWHDMIISRHATYLYITFLTLVIR